MHHAAMIHQRSPLGHDMIKTDGGEWAATNWRMQGSLKGSVAVPQLMSSGLWERRALGRPGGRSEDIDAMAMSRSPNLESLERVTSGAYDER